MNLRVYFFLLFFILSIAFLFASYTPQLIPNLLHIETEAKFIQFTTMIASALSLIIFIITNHIETKQIQERERKYQAQKLNIEQIHAELEALRK